MPLRLHNLKSSSHKRKKRVGRGNASGHGTYSTRGMKGQRSRSGGKRKATARSSFLQQFPKLKGFKSARPKSRVVNIGELGKKFKDGALVSPSTLLRAGLIGNIKGGVKILGEGVLRLKNLEIEGCKVSRSARAKIEKKGGRIIETKTDKNS